MIRIGTVWDRTLDVVRGRAVILGTLALWFVFVPSVVSAAFRSFGGATPSLALLGGLIGIAMTVLLIVGVLAMTAVASDPAVGQAEGTRIATGRLGPALGVLLVMMVAIALVFLPGAIALLSAGVTVTAPGQIDVTRAAPGMLALAGVLLLAALLLAVWVSARLVPLFAVIVNERLGLGALRRSLALTRGSTPKLLGVILLYAIVLLVLMAAATSVAGVVTRLLLGPDALPTVAFVVAIVSAFITAGATVLQTVFYTQFYVAARDRDLPTTLYPGA